LEIRLLISIQLEILFLLANYEQSNFTKDS